MLAVRDKENLVYDTQTAAAAKSLNQGPRQLQPKTPGNKVLKTPFNLPLNEDGAPNGGKLGLNLNGRGDENLVMVGKKDVLTNKNAFVTPAPRARAALGPKTTNAKARGLQTPGLGAGDYDIRKTVRRSATGQKAGPRIINAETTKLGLWGDVNREESEIEYMPPRAKDLPDLPDDMPHDINLSMFEGNGLTRGMAKYFMNKPDEEGLSYIQRRELEERESLRISDLKDAALGIKMMDSTSLLCLHEPDCPNGQCKDWPEQKRKAEEVYQKTISEIEAGRKLPQYAPAPKPAAKRTEPVPKGPSTLTSKSAALALSMKSSTTTATAAAKHHTDVTSKARPPLSFTSSNRGRVTPPSNISSTRHVAARPASNTTLGYSRGRAASGTLRRTVLPPKSRKDSNEPKVTRTSLEDLYRQLRSGPCDENAVDETEEARNAVTASIMEDAEEEFAFAL